MCGRRAVSSPFTLTPSTSTNDSLLQPVAELSKSRHFVSHFLFLAPVRHAAPTPTIPGTPGAPAASSTARTGWSASCPTSAVVVPWDEIDWIWDRGRRFRTRGGAEVTLPESLEGLPTLIELLFRETFQRLRSATPSSSAAAPVEFGPVTLTRGEITAGERRVPWAEVGGVVVAWGRFRVPQGERVPVLEVPLAEGVQPARAAAALVERLPGTAVSARS